MSNQVKQLELDFGMLTVDQQERVDSFKRNQERNSTRRIESIKHTQELLLSGGFQEGIHFVNDFKCETITEFRSFGYGENEFEAEVTFDNTTGGCSLITDYFNSQKNEMTIRTVSVSREGDKLECTYITSQYRAYKPTSLFSKLQDYNTDQKNKHAYANKTKSILNHTIDKYKKLFPNATVEEGSDYYKGSKYNYTEFPIVYVKFDSGSYVSFKLGSEIDKEYTHKKFDRVASDMSINDTLEVFNNQEVKK
jgi:hypothetical protein